MDGSLRAIIFVAYGAGNLPAVDPDWISFIKRVDQNNIVVFLVSQSIHGSVNLQLYDSGQRAEKSGATGLGNMTIESAYVKLQKILVNTQDKQGIIEKLKQNWAGEI
jgi:L-asparaginase